MLPALRSGASLLYAGSVLALFEVQNAVMTIATLAVFALQAWAFIDAVSHRPEAFAAANTLNKPGWLIILGLALVAHMLFWNPIGILNLAGTVAAIVYLVDARPALRELTRRR
jgi:hypothetical protein